MVLTLLNYQSPRYRGPQNKPDSVTQQIIGWQSVWGFFDIPRNKGGKFLNNLWFCVFQIGTHNLRGINERFSFNKFILVFSSRKAKARTSAFELFTVDNLRCQLGWEYLSFFDIPYGSWENLFWSYRQLEIFLLFSRSGTLQEKYFGFPQSLTHFVGWYLTNVLANFHENPRNLQTP